METLEQLMGRVSEISKLDIKELPPNQLEEISNELDEIINKGTNILLQQIQNTEDEKND